MQRQTADQLNENWDFWTSEYNLDNQAYECVTKFKGILPHDIHSINPPPYLVTKPQEEKKKRNEDAKEDDRQKHQKRQDKHGQEEREKKDREY